MIDVCGQAEDDVMCHPVRHCQSDREEINQEQVGKSLLLMFVRLKKKDNVYNV